MRYVLDTGFFLSGMDPAAIDGECYITPEIREEVKKGFPARKLEYFLESGVIVVHIPSEKSVREIRKEAEKTGEIRRLSKADISILALALELPAVLVTDDYSVQNIATLIGIEYLRITEKGIKGVWKWAYRCTGCGRIFPEPHDICPVCGSMIRTIPLKNGKNGDS